MIMIIIIAVIMLIVTVTITPTRNIILMRMVIVMFSNDIFCHILKLHVSSCVLASLFSPEAAEARFRGRQTHSQATRRSAVRPSASHDYPMLATVFLPSSRLHSVSQTPKHSLLPTRHFLLLPHTEESFPCPIPPGPFPFIQPLGYLSPYF